MLISVSKSKNYAEITEFIVDVKHNRLPTHAFYLGIDSDPFYLHRATPDIDDFYNLL